MRRIAFIFPGQGSQYAGMGREAYDHFPIARDVFHEADEALGYPLSDLCFNGPEDRLKLTENTQPAILTVSVAILRVLQERGFAPEFVAGHSLGEYSALVCAGALPLKKAVVLVRNRGRYMQEAVPPGDGAMAAVLGLSAEEVAEVCREASSEGIVAPANFNSPDQTVIAGEASAVRKAADKMRERGAKRVLPLPVSAPFHCALMKPAEDRLASDLSAEIFQDLNLPLISNVDAAEVRRGEAARDSLMRQVCAPVRWVESIQHLAEQGVTHFVEVGPGRVLSGLVRKIAPAAHPCSVDGIRGIEALASALADATM
jgi:[acyl-carrier-protein] S-malonyltransferase